MVGSCYGGVESAAQRFLMALACLELRQHDSEAYCTRTGLDPLVHVSARSQFRDFWLRHSSTHIGHALVKATVKRLHWQNQPWLILFPIPLITSPFKFLVLSSVQTSCPFPSPF